LKLLNNLSFDDSILGDNLDNIKIEIEKIYLKYEKKFIKIPENRLTEYEIVAGYTNKSRTGSKNFWFNIMYYIYKL